MLIVLCVKDGEEREKDFESDGDLDASEYVVLLCSLDQCLRGCYRINSASLEYSRSSRIEG